MRSWRRISPPPPETCCWNCSDRGLFAGKALGKAGDRTANAFIMEALAEQRPDDAVLSEEEQDNPAAAFGAPGLDRRSAGRHARIWRGAGRIGRCMSRWPSMARPDAGAVALPGLGLTFMLRPRPTVPPAPRGRACWSAAPARPREAVAVAEALGAELVPMGSAGAKTMAILRGEADIYLHSGGQYEWDNCAPAAVALAAGLHVSRIDGTPLVYNNADPYLPDLLICRKHLVPSIMAALRKAAA